MLHPLSIHDFIFIEAQGKFYHIHSQCSLCYIWSRSWQLRGLWSYYQPLTLKWTFITFITRSCNLVLNLRQMNSNCTLYTAKCILLGSYAESSGNSLATFRDNLPWRWDRSVVPKLHVRNYQYSLRKISEDRSSRLFWGGSLKLHPSPSSHEVHFESLQPSAFR